MVPRTEKQKEWYRLYVCRWRTNLCDVPKHAGQNWKYPSRSMVVLISFRMVCKLVCILGKSGIGDPTFLRTVLCHDRCLIQNDLLVWDRQPFGIVRDHGTDIPSPPPLPPTRVNFEWLVRFDVHVCWDHSDTRHVIPTANSAAKSLIAAQFCPSRWCTDLHN